MSTRPYIPNIPRKVGRHKGDCRGDVYYVSLPNQGYNVCEGCGASSRKGDVIEVDQCVWILVYARTTVDDQMIRIKKREPGSIRDDNSTQSILAPGAVYYPAVEWCARCGRVRDGLYADMDMNAYWVVAEGDGSEEYERAAYAGMGGCLGD